MCGIVGIYNHQSEHPPSEETLLHMIGALAHRGPDGQGVYCEGPVGLGHRRLSIIDVDGGAQPLANEDQSIWVIFNGEIYNFRQLRADLETKGHRFRTSSDTEVIVHLYEEYQTRCLDHLNGIFALAIWDSTKQQVLLARDPFGVKPLYYTQTSQKLAFASEIKALLADPSLSREVDLTALDWYLTYRFVPSPRTMLGGIWKLPPGHQLLVDRSGARLTRYTEPGLAPPLRVNLAQAVEIIKDEFAAAVKRQMVSDVPIGALLSGGVDSGAIVAEMARQSARVRTYTVGFDEGGETNELPEAREVAQLFGTDHHEIVVSAKECVEALPKVIWHLDEPISTSSALPLYYITQIASDEVKVTLAGQGADEPFAGYRRYLGERYAGVWATIPPPIRAVVQAGIQRAPRGEAWKRAVRSLATADDAERFRQVYAVFPDDLKHRLLRADVREASQEPSIAPVRRWLAGLTGYDSLAKMQYVDARLSLADDLLMYGDKITMANSIEMRVPFLDLEFMRVVERIPSEHKLHGAIGKYAWKRAALHWLPARIINRPKRGFATPIDRWFRGSLNGYIRNLLLDDQSASSRYFDPSVVRQLIEDHHSGRQDYQRQLFSLISFEIWHRQFVR